MTVARGFLITIASSVSCGVLGAILGFVLGKFVPDYYVVMFHIPPSINIEPTHLGIALGLTQGLIAGLIMGLVIVAVVAWYQLRLEMIRATRAGGRGVSAP